MMKNRYYVVLVSAIMIGLAVAFFYVSDIPKSKEGFVEYAGYANLFSSSVEVRFSDGSSIGFPCVVDHIFEIPTNKTVRINYNGYTILNWKVLDEAT